MECANIDKFEEPEVKCSYVVDLWFQEEESCKMLELDNLTSHSCDISATRSLMEPLNGYDCGVYEKRLYQVGNNYKELVAHRRFRVEISETNLEIKGIE